MKKPMHEVARKVPSATRYRRWWAGLISLLTASQAYAQEPSTTSPELPRKTAEAPRDASATPSIPKLSFEEAIRRAMAHHPDVQVAEQEIRRSQGLLAEARSSWVPTLTANASYTRLDADRVLGGRVLANANQLSANLTLVVPIIQPKGWATTARASEGVDLSKIEAVDTKRQIAVAAARAYLTVIAQRRVLESSVHAREQAAAHEKYAKEREQGGIGNRLDFVRAGQERAASETRVESQTAALVKAQEALGVLLGENAPVDASDTALPDAPTLSNALNDAEVRRSDVLSQKQRVEIARKSIRDNYTEYMPMLSAMAQPFYQNPATPTLPETGWQAQLLLSIPLYDGGRRSGLSEERSVTHEESQIQLNALLRQARADVRSSFEAMRRADVALDRAREAKALAEESLDLAQLAYRAGATTNIEVIDAERRALDASTDAAIAEDAARQARLDLLAASGRFP